MYCVWSLSRLFLGAFDPPCAFPPQNFYSFRCAVFPRNLGVFRPEPLYFLTGSTSGISMFLVWLWTAVTLFPHYNYAPYYFPQNFNGFRQNRSIPSPYAPYFPRNFNSFQPRTAVFSQCMRRFPLETTKNNLCFVFVLRLVKNTIGKSRNNG